MNNNLIANILILIGFLLFIPLLTMLSHQTTLNKVSEPPLLTLQKYGEEMNEIISDNPNLSYTLSFTNMTEPTPQMKRIAFSLRKETAWNTIWNTYKWVYNNIEYIKDNETFPGSMPASESFRKGKGICDEQALVLISLLRVNGIASRYRFEVNDEGKQHACTEVLYPYNGFYKIVKVGCLDGYKRVKVKEW